jgi:hypothetical protein
MTWLRLGLCRSPYKMRSARARPTRSARSPSVSGAGRFTPAFPGHTSAERHASERAETRRDWLVNPAGCKCGAEHASGPGRWPGPRVCWSSTRVALLLGPSDAMPPVAAALGPPLRFSAPSPASPCRSARRVRRRSPTPRAHFGDAHCHPRSPRSGRIHARRRRSHQPKPDRRGPLHQRSPRRAQPDRRRRHAHLGDVLALPPSRPGRPGRTHRSRHARPTRR